MSRAISRVIGPPDDNALTFARLDTLLYSRERTWDVRIVAQTRVAQIQA